MTYAEARKHRKRYQITAFSLLGACIVFMIACVAVGGLGDTPDTSPLFWVTVGISGASLLAAIGILIFDKKGGYATRSLLSGEGLTGDFGQQTVRVAGIADYFGGRYLGRFVLKMSAEGITGKFAGKQAGKGIAFQVSWTNVGDIVFEADTVKLFLDTGVSPVAAVHVPAVPVFMKALKACAGERFSEKSAEMDAAVKLFNASNPVAAAATKGNSVKKSIKGKAIVMLSVLMILAIGLGVGLGILMGGESSTFPIVISVFLAITLMQRIPYPVMQMTEDYVRFTLRGFAFSQRYEVCMWNDLASVSVADGKMLLFMLKAGGAFAFPYDEKLWQGIERFAPHLVGKAPMPQEGVFDIIDMPQPDGQTPPDESVGE